MEGGGGKPEAASLESDWEPEERDDRELCEDEGGEFLEAPEEAAR